MITVCAVTGIDPMGHMEAIERTQRAIPHYTKMEFRFVPGMDLPGYSEFIVKKLDSLISTEHVLICQADGFGRNIEHWTDEFLEYDYIGACWPNHEVGNGGLSLRSKRFLGASAALQSPDLPEDAYLCQYHRKELESQGIRFAPMELALRFSFEHPVEGVNWDKSQSWGTHGAWHNS